MLTLNINHHLKKFKLNVALTVGQELVALFGPSGAGKSVTLQAVAGLIRPQTGQIFLNGRTLFDHAQGINLPPQRRRVGYVMQDYTLFPHLSVAQNIAYGLRGQPTTAIRQAVADMLDLIQLTGYAEHRPHELSGGQQQRVALARALVTNPEVLLLDEPFSALDGPTRAQLRLELRQLQTRLQIPTLLVTHDLAEANILANRIAVFSHGAILQLDSPAEIMRRPATLQVANLTNTQNFFAGTVVQANGAGLQVSVGPLRLDTPVYPFSPGQKVHCCIRPEQVLIIRPDRPARQHENLLQGRVVSIITDGLSYTLSITLTGSRLHPNRPHDLAVALPLHVFESLAPAVGQVWHVSLKQSAIHLIAA